MTLTRNLNTPVFFYCAECEKKIQCVPFFRTHCPCGESECLVNLYEIKYFGLAIPQDEWEAMEETNEALACAFNPDLVRFNR